MSTFICELTGVRGRSLRLYDNKCEITTDVTLGSALTSNALDGRKTIFFIDVVGVQFKESGFAIGYLQLETPSMQMNNQSSNMFSENTFTFEEGKNGVTNCLMRYVHDYIISRIEGYKYGTLSEVPVEVPAAMVELIPEKGEDLPAGPIEYKSNNWICAKCGAGNPIRKAKCWKCGAEKPEK